MNKVGDNFESSSLKRSLSKENRASDCVLVFERSQLVGILTAGDVVRLTAAGVNLAGVKIADVMAQPVITLKQTEQLDIFAALSLMRQHCLWHLPIVSEEQVIGIVTPESICASLQREVSDRRVVEEQLLQTTSELQEIFQAEPNLYFRLNCDRTILSYHTGHSPDLYATPAEFLGKRIQDVLPPDVARQFEEAIAQIFETNSLVAIEYSLPLPAGEKSFEARLFPSQRQQIIVIVRDISERKLAEQALQTAKEELEIRVLERTDELRQANLLLQQEIVQRQRIEQELRYRIQFEKLIATISTHFINLAPAQIDNGINQALQSIGESADVDRSYVFLFSDDTRMDNTHEWCAAGIEPQIDNLKDIPLELFSWAMEKFQRFEIIHIPRVTDLPLEANIEKELLLSQGIQSAILVPIVCNRLLIGYLGFDCVRSLKIWTEDTIALLKMVGEIFANALERKRVEQALQISEERYATAISAGIGVWDWNIETNEMYLDPNLKAMLGYADHEIQNHLNDWSRFVHPDDIERVMIEVRSHFEGLTPLYEIEYRMLHKDGSIRWFLARGNALFWNNGKPYRMAGSNTDITELKQAENQIKVSLKEKEVLLKEIHHRVKNNLQVISSLLRLQAGYIKDEKTIEIFKESQNRVRAMALIHEKLYQSSTLSKIDFQEYIRNLTTNLFRSYGVNPQLIQLKLHTDNSKLKIDAAIPCGLIINELVSNSLKHAFPNEILGEIEVVFTSCGEGKYSLIVSDNGVGIPQSVDLSKAKSLGLRLVCNLVEQLDGSIAFNTSNGSVFKINFLE